MKKLSILLIVFSFFIASAGAAEGPSAPAGASKKTLSELNEAKTASREAKKNAEVAISDLTKSIENLEAELRKIEDESVRVMAEREKRADKMVTAVEAAVASGLEQATRDNIRILNKRLQILKARVRTEEELLQAKEEVVALLERELRLELEVQTLSIDDAASAKSDVVVAESQLQEVQSTRRERKAVLGSRKEKLKSKKHKAVDDREFADKELKRHEKLSPKGGEAEKDFLSNIASLQQMRLANVNEEIETAKHNIKLAEKELERAELEESNAEHKLALLKKRSSLLEKRLSDVEMSHLRKEEALARETEEESRQKAREEIAALQKQETEALKKVGELEQRKLAAVAAEERRKLELGVTVFKLRAEIARKKEALITEETRRHRSNTEFKRLNKEVRAKLGGENTPSEIRSDIAGLNEEAKLWRDKLNVVNTLYTTIQKEIKVVSEKLELVKSELTAPPGGVSKTEQEAAAFKDKVLAEQYVAYTKERLTLLEEDKALLENLLTKIEKERKVIILDGLKLLEDTKTKLSKLQVVNIWTRREWGKSWSGMKKGLRHILRPGELSDLITVMEEPSRGKLRIWVAIAGVLSLIAATVLGSYYARRWCRLKLIKLKEAGN